LGRQIRRMRIWAAKRPEGRAPGMVRVSRTAAIRYRKPGAGSAGKGVVGRSGIEPASGEI
jgi:hypothetical protein